MKIPPSGKALSASDHSRSDHRLESLRRVLIICPLQHEARGIRRRLLQSPDVERAEHSVRSANATARRHAPNNVTMLRLRTSPLSGEVGADVRSEAPSDADKHHVEIGIAVGGPGLCLLNALRSERPERTPPADEDCARSRQPRSAAPEPIAAFIETADLMLLAGVAGGLRASVTPGSAWWANEIRSDCHPEDLMHPTFALNTFSNTAADAAAADDDEERRRTPSQHATGIVQTNHVVAADEDRTRLAEAFRFCSLVDMESWIFARFARERGCAWGIIRGVTDTVGSELPPGMERWMNRRGGLRPIPLMMDLLRHPQMSGSLRHLAIASTAALSAVAEEILSAISATASNMMNEVDS